MNTTHPSLLQLLRRSGDKAGWERFVSLYTPLLFSWANKLGLQDSDAADLVQNTFVTLVEKLPEFQYDPAQCFRAWLKTVVLNLRRDQLRQAKRVPATGGGTYAEPETPDSCLDADEAEYRQLLVQRALALMQSDFEPSTWQACWEHVVNGRSAAEVGAALGLTAGAVYVAKYRVLNRLRQELGEFLR